MTHLPVLPGARAKTPKATAPQNARRLPIRRQDKAFLPSALQVLETPPAPLASLMIAIICAFFAAAAVWSYYGQIDVIAVAQGKVQPIGRIKTVQSARPGRVMTLAVDDGAKVKAGDVLFQLDPRAAIAEKDAVTAELSSYEAEIVRRRAAIQGARTDLTALVVAADFPDSISPSIRDSKRRALEADFSALKANLAKLTADLTQKTAEKSRLAATIAAQRDLLAILQERVDMRAKMETANIGSRASVIDADETLATQKATLAQETGQLGEISANLDVIRGQMDAAVKSFIADNAEKLDEAERQVSIFRQRLARADLELDQTTIRSPIDGVVQSSALTTIGQVVNPGDELMRVVPEDAGLEIECYLPNKDIGFVKPGQSAVLKIESFPFTRYGTIEATVTRVAKDAIPEPDANLAEADPTRTKLAGKRSGADRLQNLVYPVTLRPSRLSLDVDGSKVPLRAGMALTVEIKTGERRLIDYVLSPIQQVQTEALRER